MSCSIRNMSILFWLSLLWYVTYKCNPSLPFLSTAGSILSFLLVVPTTKRFETFSRPSMTDKNCETTLLLRALCSPLLLEGNSESISSTTMSLFLFLGHENTSLNYFSVSPTILLNSAGPLTYSTSSSGSRLFHYLAIAEASSDFPVPGGP